MPAGAVCSKCECHVARILIRATEAFVTVADQQADDIPDMNEFLVRGIPLAVAVDARARWHAMTADEKHALGFNPGESSSTKSPARSYRGSLH